MNIRAVYPGTFDPIHFGHMNIVERAARLFEEVIVAVYDRPLKSLVFSAEERIAFVEEAVRSLKVKNARVVGYNGLTVEFCRQQRAQVLVRGLRVFSDFEFEFRMALANRRLAPEIDIVTLITNEEHTFLSSTTVREIASLGGDTSTMVPPHVQAAFKQHYADFSDDRMTSLRD